MAKKNIVVEIMKKRLAPYSFQYKGYCYCRWTFSREIEEITQNIVIQKGQYDKSYTLELELNDIAGSSCRFNSITDDPEFKEQFISYNTEEEQINVLNKLGDFVEKYGINKLNELVEWEKNRVKPILPTIEMSKKLCEEHAELTIQFIQRNHAEDLSEEQILEIVKEDLVKLRGKNYEDIQDNLVELTAVYGNMFIRKVGGRLSYNDVYKVAVLTVPLDPYTAILEKMVTAWQKSQENYIIELYDLICTRNIEVIKLWRQDGGDDWQKKSFQYKKCGYKIPLH